MADAAMVGLRIIECSALAPVAITTAPVDLGAEVTNVEPRAGDYIRPRNVVYVETIGKVDYPRLGAPSLFAAWILDQCRNRKRAATLGRRIVLSEERGQKASFSVPN